MGWGERWAAKIRNPPTLLDKLGVKAGQDVAEIGLTDPDLLTLLEQKVDLFRTLSFSLDSVAHDIMGAELDLVFVQVSTRADFAFLPIAAQSIAQDGAV